MSAAGQPAWRSLWGQSLTFRLVVASSLAVLTLLALTGAFLLDQSSRGILAGKKQASLAEVSLVLDGIQRDLRTLNPNTSTVNERLTQLAQDAAHRGAVGRQYYVVLAGPVAEIGSAGLDYTSVPESLRRAVLDADGVHTTPTRIRFTDARVALPGLAVGAALSAPDGTRYPVYFLFSQQAEADVLAVVQRATALAGLIVLAGVVVTVYLTARRVLRPIRAARVTAERLAAGQLDERMAVRGTEDLASLARSMNHLAIELDRKISQLEELTRVQQQFVSDVSHELRTPLTTVRMAADLLHAQRHGFDPVAARSAELLSAELDRFEELLTDLLEISRFDAGAAELLLEEVDLAALAAEEVAAQTNLAESFHTPLRLDATSACVAEVDARRIRRILRNLITNAIEHGEGRPVSVHVRTDADAAVVAVRDHGLGFSAAVSEQVFNRFWRADPARRRTVGGTGLGLAIALGDARLHGGWLDAWGRPGEGAQLRLTVPRTAGGQLTSSPWPAVPEDVGVRA